MYKKFIGSVIVVIVLLQSCGDENLNQLRMGEEYINDESGIVLIDTLSLELSTVIMDSVLTSSTSTALVGKYNHEIFGEVNADAIFRLSLPQRLSFEEEDVFDSITISMNYNDYFIGDTTEVFQLQVFELVTDLEELRRTGFYNISEVDTKDEKLGNLTLYPQPNKSDMLEMRISDDLGKKWFDLLVHEEEEFQGVRNFQDYFKGIVLRGNGNNKSIVGFEASDTSLYVNLYYHRINEDVEELEVKFPLENSYYQFNTIKSERDGTDFQSLLVQDEGIKSKETQDVSIVQGGTGLVTKVNFPGLANVFQLVQLDQIIKAELILKPIKGADEINDLPFNLLVYESNRVNKINGAVVDNQNNPVPMIFNPPVDHYGSLGYYSIDITEYLVRSLITGYFNQDNALLISLPSDGISETVTTLMLGGEANEDYTPELKLYTYYY